MKKSVLAIAALSALAGAMTKQNDIYGRWDSQDSDFKALRQNALDVLAMPDDVDEAPAVAAPVVVDDTVFKDQVLALLGNLANKEPTAAPAPEPSADDIAYRQAVLDKLAGVEDTMAAVMHLLPEPAAA